VTSLLDEETKYKVIPLLCKYITIFNKIHEDVIELAFFSNSFYENLMKGNRPESILETLPESSLSETIH